nr:transmembrane protein, putative [Ipomoea batatas]GMD18047.1 transmembrane protein, putative [Ipomoea batatas]
MARTSSLSSMHPWVLVILSAFLQLIPGLADDSSSSNSGTKAPSHSSSSSTKVVVLGLCLGMLALVGFAFVLFKIWQKKRREEQHARLLKLFEEDDDLEVELGIRD